MNDQACSSLSSMTCLCLRVTVSLLCGTSAHSHCTHTNTHTHVPAPSLCSRCTEPDSEPPPRPTPPPLNPIRPPLKVIWRCKHSKLSHHKKSETSVNMVSRRSCTAGRSSITTELQLLKDLLQEPQPAKHFETASCKNVLICVWRLVSLQRLAVVFVFFPSHNVGVRFHCTRGQLKRKHYLSKSRHHRVKFTLV